jgi:fructosamine-3-kinase
MFEAEVQGLTLLGDSNFRIPKVLGTGQLENRSYLILEYIDSRGAQLNSAIMGAKLAQMHQMSSGAFGLDHNNYIGAIAQENTAHRQWTHFYQSMRIEPLVKTAFDKSLMDKKMMHSFDAFCGKLDDLIPKESPSLIHGDLWQGNVICDEHSNPVLIDPAVYYGHREMDIAMLLLFGSIHEDSITAYNEIYPLESQWEKRTEIHQLYPLLVHLILFGSSYLGNIQNIVKKYV